jgi:hypothetical protein
MADLATLGIAVDSSAVAAGTTSLQSFAAAADVTGAAADGLSAKLTTGMQGAAGSYVSNADRITAASKQMNTVLSQVNATTGVTGGSDYAARGADIAAYGKQLDDLRSKYDPLYAASQNYKAALTGINEAARVGAISEQVRADAVMNTKVAFVEQVNTLRGVRDASDDATRATNALGHAHEGMSTQAMSAFHSIRSMAEGLAMGMPPTQVLTQQLNHLSYAATGPGGLAGAFGEVIGMAGNLVTPFTVAIASTVVLTAAAAALAMQYDRVQVSSQKALIGAGGRTGTSVGDLNSFTEQNASGLSGTGLSTKEARKLGEDFTASGEIVISRLHGMSDAVVGFSNQTGKSMSDASKDMVAFAVDPQKGMDTLSQTYGAFDIATRKAVDALVLADDKTGAFQVVIDALADKSKKAADNMGFFEKATRGVINALATETNKPSGLENQIETARGRLNSAIDASTNTRKPEEAYAAGESIPKLSKDFETLQAAMEKVKTQNLSAEFNKLSTDADAVDKAIIPQIAQIKQLETELAALERAKAAGQTSKYGAAVDGAALVAAQNQLKIVQESEAQAARYNDRVAEIAGSWGDVSTQTALQLQQMQNQLPIAQAVTGEEQMQAQYLATINDLLDKNKTLTEATAIAAGQMADAQARATANVEKQVQSLKDSTAMINAQANGNEAQVAAGIAYKKAMDSGADSAAASALSSETLANYAAKAALSAQQQAASMAAAADSSAQAFDAAQKAANAAGQGIGTFIPEVMTQAAGAFDGDPSHGGAYYKNGGQGKHLDTGNPNALYLGAPLTIDGAVSRYIGQGDYPGALNAAQNFHGTGDNSAQINMVDQLTQLMNGRTSDKGAQTSNLQAEMAWLNTLPETIARDQKLVSLQQSIDQLTTATTANTAATLNPLYTQGAGALAIGYYHAATGLEGVVGGSGGTDSQAFHAMLTPGEHVKITPPGQQSSASGGSGGTPVVIQNFDFRGTQSNSRRSARQAAQGFGQTAAAMR